MCKEMSNVKSEKALLRNYYRKLRNSIPEDEKERLDELIFQRIISNSLYNECKILLIYYSVNSEVDTLRLIKHALSIGKTIALPRCNADRTMSFYKINSLDNLEISAYGISEPAEDFDMLISIFDGALCMVPALAFDKNGYRLGYGGGYYDRFLSTHEKINTLGICYSVCLADNLIREEHDISIDYLLTEKDFVEVCNG